MWRRCLLAVVLLAIPAAASAKPRAEQISGPDALALAEIVGEQSPTITEADKTLLQGYLDGKAATAHTKGHTVHVTAKSIHCGSDTNDLTERQCEMMFGKTRVPVRGREAEALNATLALVGAPEVGAAGSTFYSIDDLDCTVAADSIKARDGSGADCTFSHK